MQEERYHMKSIKKSMWFVDNKYNTFFYGAYITTNQCTFVCTTSKL